MSFRNSMGWADPDSTEKVHSYVNTLDRANAADSIKAYKQRTYELAGATTGRRILDLGCGTGYDAMAMATLVGNGGEVVGIDRSEGMVKEARQRAEGVGLPVRFEVGDAMALPFPDNYFDGARADRVFQHLADPERALAEMIRVVRPGGSIVLTDPDYGSSMMDVADIHLGRRVKTFLTDLVANPWSGRKLKPMMQTAGLTDLTLSMTIWEIGYAGFIEQFRLPEALALMEQKGLIAGDEAAAFQTELETRAAAGLFFAANVFFIASGTKPGK